MNKMKWNKQYEYIMTRQTPERQKMIYERQQLREQIISVVGIIFLSITIIGLIMFVLMMLKDKYGW